MSDLKILQKQINEVLSSRNFFNRERGEVRTDANGDKREFNVNAVEFLTFRASYSGDSTVSHCFIRYADGWYVLKFKKGELDLFFKKYDLIECSTFKELEAVLKTKPNYRTKPLFAGSDEDFYRWLISESIPLITIKKVFPNFKDIDLSSNTEKSIKVYNFNLHNYDEKKHKAILKKFEDACDMIKKLGQSKLLYGEVFFVPKPRGRKTLADYTMSDDSIRIYDSALKDASRGANSFEWTIIHEIFHRYWYKFCDDRNVLISKFQELMRSDYQQNREMLATVKVGARFIFNKRPDDSKITVFIYKGTKVVKRQVQAVFEYETMKGYTTTMPLSYMKNGMTEIDAQGNPIEPKGDTVPTDNKPTKNPWFPTSYAKTNTIEWFPELVASSILNDDNKEVKKFVKEFLK